MSEEDRDDLLIGRLAAPVGLAGDIRVVLETDYPERFAHLERVRVELLDGTSRELPVERSRVGGHRITLKFAGYDTPEAVSRLTGGLLLIPRSQAMPLPEGHYYEHQIVGLEVVDSAGRPLGQVSQILRTGANDVYVAGDLLIPATREVVKRIDLERHQLVVDLPAEE